MDLKEMVMKHINNIEYKINENNSKESLNTPFEEFNVENNKKDLNINIKNYDLDILENNKSKNEDFLKDKEDSKFDENITNKNCIKNIANKNEIKLIYYIKI